MRGRLMARDDGVTFLFLVRDQDAPDASLSRAAMSIRLASCARRAALSLAVVAAFAVPGQLRAQDYPSVDLGGRVQAQYAHSSIDAADNDFFFRRVRLRADIAVNEWITGRIQPDFASGGTSLQDAYVDFGFSEGLNIRVGQSKRPFDLFDLSSSTDLSLIERDGRIEGLGGCPAVGGLCSHNRITESLEFSGRDRGVMLDGTAGRVEYAVMVSNGQGANTSDVNDGKSISSRVVVAASEDLRIAGKLGVHDYLSGATETSQAVAFGVDAEWGTWRDGFHAQLSLISGENWALPVMGDPVTFQAVEGWAAYYHPLDGERVVGIEPLLRVGYADANTDGVDDAGTLFTPGLMFYFGGRNKLGANMDVYLPQTGGTEYSLKIQTFLYF